MKVEFKADDASFAALKASLEARARSVMQEAAQKSTEEIYEEAVRGVGYFYSSYTPTTYERHYQMRKTPHKHVQSQRWGYAGWVEMNADSLYSIYHDTPQYVFGGFIEGFHGGTGIETAPSPHDMLMEAYEAVVAHAASYIQF